MIKMLKHFPLFMIDFLIIFNIIKVCKNKKMKKYGQAKG